MPELNVKKNIILFSLESMRAGFFQTFGGIYPSPQMSRLAEQSCVFTKMFSASPSTTMSLSTVLNGRYGHEFSRECYEDSTVFSDNLFALMKQSGRRNFLCLNDYIHPANTPKIHSGDDVELTIIPRTSNVTTDMAKKVIDIAETTAEPYFLFAHGAPLGFCTEEELPNWRTGLERAVWHDDLAIGLLLDAIDFETTTLIVYGDHGLLTGEHHQIMKHAFFLYDEGVHVPCLVTDGTPKVVPELCSLTNLHSLIVKGSFTPPKRVFADSQYVNQPHRITMVREDQWKYMAHYHWQTAVTGLQEELYDLTTDPQEHRNLLNMSSRHPLRFEWTQHNMSEFETTFAYNDQLLKSKLTELRGTVAEIWRRGVLRMVETMAPDIVPDLTEQFKVCTATETLAIVSKIVQSTLHQEQTYYGQDNRALALEPEFHFKYFPELPENRKNINFSKLLSPDLEKLQLLG